MKATCDSQALLRAYNVVSGFVPARSPKPILQSMKLSVTEDGSVLAGTNLEIGVRCQVLGVQSKRPGEAILPTVQIGSILKTSDTEIEITVDGDHLKIQGDHSSFRLNSESPDLFPDVPDFDATDYYIVSAADMKRLIRRTVFATDPEITKYALSGTLVEISNTSISLIASDGRQLAKMTSPVEIEGSPTIPAAATVIPAKALKLIDRNLADDDPPVHLAVSPKGSVLIRTEHAVIYSRLVEGRFPNYRDVFPASCNARIPCVVGPLRSAVEQSMIVTSEESRGVDFAFGDGMLKLFGQSADVGDSRVELPIDYSGATIEMTLDACYLANALRVLGDDAEITIELVDSKKAFLLRTEDGYEYVVMPMMRNRNGE